MKRGFYIFVCFLLFSDHFFGQNAKIDSLLTLLKTDKADTNKVGHLNDLSWQYDGIGLYDSAMHYANTALQLSYLIYKEATGSKVRKTLEKDIANSYNIAGNVYKDKGNYPEALKNYFASLKIREAINDKKGIASSYGSIGNVYYYQGNYPEALKNHFASLKICEAIDDKKGIARSYNNIGNVYDNQGNYPEALKNYVASLKIKKSLDDKKGIAGSYHNLGVIYMEQGNYPEALKNYFASSKIREEIGDKVGIAASFNNIGNVYYAEATQEGNEVLRGNQFDQALKNHFASLKIREMMGDKAGVAGSFGNIGKVYAKQKKYKDAEEYLIKAVDLSKEIRFKEYLRDSYNELSRLDSAKGNFKGAYERHKLYILYRDSLNNEETRRKTIQGQMTYDFEKKEAVVDAEHKKELANQQVVAEEKSRKQKVVLLLVSFFLALVLVFAGFVFRSLRVTRKQKNIIQVQKQLVEQQKEEVELQKHLVDEKQKEVIDSITYARRIQRSLLPTEKYIEKCLKKLMK